ncbi:MAG: zinc-binding dehydrogenase [Deltaproteobacteria bacterium]|nr:zinc-binding dehydrogenase [Deltaproteobacteria bacterium]
MRSVWIPRIGPPEVLEVREVPDPHAGPGEVRVRVRASGVNFADCMARMGLYPDAPKLPCVVGYEVAGTIDEVGAGVEDVAAGTAVLTPTRFNGYAELVVVPAAQIVPLPEGMTFEQGAALPVNYLTAILMLEMLAQVRAGERVLIHGAAGGVGLAAVQLCLLHGAEVIGTASASKHAALREAGVAHVIDYRTGDVESEVRRLTGGRGVDVVLDAIGGEHLRQSYRVLAPLGRLVAFGFSAAAPGTSRRVLTALWQLARMPRFSPVTLMNDNRAVMGVNLGHLWEETALLRTQLATLVDYYRAGKIRPTVGRTFPLVEAAAAHAYIQGRQNVGKVVLTT